MFELVVSFLFLIVYLSLESLALKVWLFVGFLILLSPSLYGMIKGAPFVPTHQRNVGKIVKLSGVKKGESVRDLGCGDGRILRAFWNAGVRDVVGYEVSVFTYFYALWWRLRLKTGERVLFKNFWKEDFSEVDVIVCFLSPRALERVYEEIWPQMKKGARLVSYAFKVEGVKFDGKYGAVYLYKKND